MAEKTTARGEFGDLFEQLKRERQAERDALATVRCLKAILSAGKAWFGPGPTFEFVVPVECNIR
jgi:hypothetical protein